MNIRPTENELDARMHAIFDILRVEDDEFRIPFREELRQATNWDQRSSAQRVKQFLDELIAVRDQQDRLLNLRMLEEIDSNTFASKSRDLRDREAELKLEIDVADRGRHDIIDIAVKAFQLSQSLREKWFEADYAAKRRILEILCLNCSLDGASLVATMRKPFDLLAEGLLQKDSRGDKTPLELFISGIRGWEPGLRRYFPGKVVCDVRSIRKRRLQTEAYACCSMSFFLRGDAFAALAFFAFDATFLPAALMTPIF